MKPNWNRANRRQAGYSLTEILVAVAVFAIIFVAALMIYDRSNLEFRRGVEAADVQQNTRVAFDRLVADLRMAGFDHDRDGIPTATGGTVWQPSRSYSINNIVSPTIANGFVYRASAVSGAAPFLSGATQPTWPTSIGNTVVDNEITWTTQAGVNQYQQPDEQIEHAGPTALTIRANFDYETDVANENGREPSLQTPQFPVVTTGNDEIVTYALRKYNEDGTIGTNPDTINVCMDVQTSAPYRRTHPGGLPERCFGIPSVDLSPDNPPYTLVRITFNDTGTPVYTPVANNIRRLDFTYFNNNTGTPANPVPTGWNSAAVTVEGLTHPAGTQLTNPGGGQYNPTNPVSGSTERIARSMIRSMRMNLVGMSEARDGGYTNPTETSANPEISQRRTYRLESLVVPRNIGRQGMREQQAAPPGRPVLQMVCNGYCGMAQVSWLAPSPNPNFGTVEQYIVQYGTTAGGPYPSVKQVGTATAAFITGLTPGTTYYFTVSAVNSYGSSPAADTIGSATPDVPDEIGRSIRNTTTPQPPSGLSATNGGTAQNNQITVSWTAPTGNVDPDDYARCRTPNGTLIVQDPVNIAPGEIVDYLVYRSENASFAAGSDPSDPTNQISTTAPSTMTFGVGTVSFVDRTAVNCVPYYYRVRAYDGCDSPEDGWSAVAPSGNPSTLMGESTAAAPAAKPVTFKVTPGGFCNPTKCDAVLEWSKVNADTAGPPANAIVIRDYRVVRQRRRVQLDGFGNPVVDLFGNYVMENDPTGLRTINFVDPSPMTGQFMTVNDPDNPLDLKDGSNLPYDYTYTVQARQCGDAFSSVPSDPVKWPCTFSGTVTGVTMTGVISGDGLTQGSAWLIQSPGETLSVTGTGIVSAQAILNDGTNLIDLGVDNAGPSYDFPIVNTEDGVIYSIDIIIRDSNNCLQTLTRYLEESTPAGCCLETTATDPLVVSYAPGTTSLDVFFRNLCANPLDIQEALADTVKITWTVPLGTTLTTVDFPDGSGGVVTRTLNNTTGNVQFAPPGGFQDPVPADSSSYFITLRFNPPLTGATHPITAMCLTYRRPGIDTVDQNCKFIPQPTFPNSCL